MKNVYNDVFDASCKMIFFKIEFSIPKRVLVHSVTPCKAI